MNVVTTRITVDANLRISGRAPPGLAPGEHVATITIDGPGLVSRGVRDMLVDDLPWDDCLPLRREDMYGDEGR